MFDKEEWRVARDTEYRRYAEVVDNTVDVRPRNKKPYTVHIKVPSDLFTFLRQVHKPDVEQLRMSPISFYLEETKGKWYFGAFLLEDSFDLWPYPDLPGWAYRV